jgi:hypothetical protein
MVTGQAGAPQDPGGAELDALLESANRELLAAIRGTVDTEAGLRDIAERFRRDRAEPPEDDPPGGSEVSD